MDKYDIGHASSKNTELTERCVCPVYDDSGKYFRGAIGRSLYEECKTCHSYHNPKTQCPSEDIRPLYRKWRSNKNFDRRINLYNLWEAKQEIKKTGKVILCESAGNVLRIEEAGIKFSLGCFGADLCDEQQVLLEKSGAFKVFLLMDNDEAGRIANEKIQKQLCKSFNTKIINLPDGINDIAEMKVQEVKNFLEGKLL